MIKNLLTLSCVLFAFATMTAQDRDIALASEISVALTHKDYQVSISPNPASDKIKISNASGVFVNVTVYNILGDEMSIKNDVEESIEIDISEFPDGTYIVAFQNGDTVTTKRLVKN